jgi:hypothetical protein
MLGIYNYDCAGNFKNLDKRISNLSGEALLNLRPARKKIDNPG